MMNHQWTVGVTMALLIAPAQAARAWLGDQVVRPRPQETRAADEPARGLFDHWRAQEERRLRSLRDEYPAPDRWTGRYDPVLMRDWQRRVIRQQGSAIAGAFGDAAAERCRLSEPCRSAPVQAALSAIGFLVNGVHWRAPIGPIRAKLDAPPALTMEIRRVRVSFEYRLTF
jgi:hypothetical protein